MELINEGLLGDGRRDEALVESYFLVYTIFSWGKSNLPLDIPEKPKQKAAHTSLKVSLPNKECKCSCALMLSSCRIDRSHGFKAICEKEKYLLE